MGSMDFKWMHPVIDLKDEYCHSLQRSYYKNDEHHAPGTQHFIVLRTGVCAAGSLLMCCDLEVILFLLVLSKAKKKPPPPLFGAACFPETRCVCP